MAKRVYVGSVDAIDTVLNGVQMRVERGEVVDVPAAVAEQLDAQPDNWAKPGSATKGGDS